MIAHDDSRRNATAGLEIDARIVDHEEMSRYFQVGERVPRHGRMAALAGTHFFRAPGQETAAALAETLLEDL